MSPDGEVVFGDDHEELAVGGGGAVFRRVDPGRGVGDGELGEDQGQEQALQEARGELAGRVGEQGDRVFFELVAGAGETAGFVDGVGVGEQEEATAGSLGSGPAGVVFPGEAALRGEVKRGGFEEGDALKGGGFRGDRGGLIGRAIVDDEQLPVMAELEGRIGLAEE